MINGKPSWLINVTHKGPEIEPEELGANDLYNRVKGLDNLKKPVIERIMPAIRAAFRCGGGCILIVDQEAQSEANRLRNQSFRTTPFALNDAGGKNIFSVDGAVLADFDGFCHAFGAILDGQAKSTIGDKSRGSRFNSAVRYIDSRKGLAFALVVSDDGNYDIVI